MYSNKSDYDYGQKRQYSRDSRPWDEEAKREEWPEPSRNLARDSYNSYNKYSEDGDNRVSSKGHSKTYTRETVSDRDWSRKRTTSVERVVSEKKRRTYGDEDQHRYEPQSVDSYRQSPEHFSSHAQRNNDFKLMDDSYSRKRTPEKSGRYGQRQDDYHYNQYKEESHYRPATEYYMDGEGPERSWEQEGTHSRDDFEKGYSPTRPRRGSFSRDHEDHNHNRMFPLNGSSRLSDSSRRLSPPPIPPPPPRDTGEKAMSKGFQRFLNVLNMGVNVETLTKIVNQGSPDVTARQPSPTPQYSDKPWAAEPAQRIRLWPESEGRPKPPYSPPPRSYGANGKTLSEERYVESRHFERKVPENRSASPARKPSSFEDDSKRRQMHDVLQAIGLNLEFEEVGQMSNRIQERLYGKKQTDPSPIAKEEKERARKRNAYVPKRRSRSSSESSTGSFKDYRKSHSYNSQKEENSNYKDTKPPPPQIVSPSSFTRPNPEQPPAPVMPPHSFPSVPPHLPPMFSPQYPPYHPSYPQPVPPFPPFNLFPPMIPPNVPPPLGTRHPFLPDIVIPPKPQYDVNTTVQQKGNNKKRPRCLQVISTDK